MIRNQISSDLSELNKLHTIYPWIPNENMIRPNSIELSKKNLSIALIEDDWISITDFIYHTVFNQKKQIFIKNFIPIIETDIEDFVFSKALFSYNIPTNTNHYVLWFSRIKFKDGRNVDKDFINSIINSEINKIKNSYSYDFVWYINPKPTVHNFFHVQVFFI